MKICEATYECAEAIALLHSAQIKTGFLSTLGIPFLSTLYKAISSCPYSIVLVALDDDNNVIGFVSGALSTKKMYRWILTRFGFTFFFQLALKAFNPSVLKKIVETAFYSIKENRSINEPSPDCSIEAELISIAVDRSNRGKGLGKKLVSELENWYSSIGVTRYKTVTWSKYPVSNQFYLACGFTLSNSFTHHNNVMNVYIKNLV